jgi:UDP:flavonoid glycosyltransferase YjiC (YdhE family)
MGASVTLRRPDLGEDAVRQAVRTVIDNPQYRAAAQRISEGMMAQPGPEHAALLLERLAREQRPIPRLTAGAAA